MPWHVQVSESLKLWTLGTSIRVSRNHKQTEIEQAKVFSVKKHASEQLKLLKALKENHLPECQNPRSLAPNALLFCLVFFVLFFVVLFFFVCCVLFCFFVVF